MARALGTGLSLEDILTVVVDAAIQLTRTERGVLLLTSASGELQTIVARNAQKSTLRPEDLQVSGSVVKRVAASRRELIVSDTGEDLPVNPQESMARLALRTVVAIPIDKLPVIEAVDVTIAARQGELLGVLYLDSRAPTSAFSALDREVLRTLAREAATVVENARLFASSREKARLDHEIQIASEIQQRLLPVSLPDLPEVAVAGSTLACYSVGGDCFDVIELGAGRRGFLWETSRARAFPPRCLQPCSRACSSRRRRWTSLFAIFSPESTNTCASARRKAATPRSFTEFSAKMEVLSTSMPGTCRP